MSEYKAVPLEQTPIWQDIKATILSGAKPVNFDYALQVHTKTGDFTALKIIEFQESNDYVADTFGSIHIQFMVSAADYNFKLYPYRDFLEVSIKKIPQKENNAIDDSGAIESIRYRGILNIKKNPRVTGDRITDMDYNSLVSSPPVTVSLELQDRNQEILRVAMIEGDIYPGATMKQVISGVMAGESNKFLIDGSPAVQQFDLVDPDNSDEVPNCYIPSIKLSLVPTYLQEKSMGVYSTGLGTHYQRYNGLPSWFVYPLYNTDRFDQDVDRAVIFAVPQDRLSGIDRTYRKEGKILYIAATGGRDYVDDSQLNDLNQGVGVRIPNAGGIFNGGADMNPSGPVTDRARLNTEVATRGRPDDVYYAPVVEATDNPFKHYSQLAARQVSQLNIVWENSYPEHIYPGMPCKYVFMDKGEYKELKGVILGKYSVLSLIGSPATSNTYRQSTHLGICLEYYIDDEAKFPTQASPGNF